MEQEEEEEEEETCMRVIGYSLGCDYRRIGYGCSRVLLMLF